MSIYVSNKLDFIARIENIAFSNIIFMILLSGSFGSVHHDLRCVYTSNKISACKLIGTKGSCISWKIKLHIKIYKASKFSNLLFEINAKY